jgi:CheY-like chemotaxis protein
VAVLVVEDEFLLREFAADVLMDSGFSVLQARDAEQALLILGEHPEVEVLFTDINMPGSMDGLKLAHAVRDRWPPVKILLVSGQVAPWRADLPPNSRFIGKPYRAAVMVEELRSLVGSSI